MNKLTIEDIQALKETCEVECKKATGKNGNGAIPTSMWETYSAFANTDGGEIFLGISEKNEKFSVEGIKDVDKVKQDLFNLLKNDQKVSVKLTASSHVCTYEVLSSSFSSKKADLISSASYSTLKGR